MVTITQTTADLERLLARILDPQRVRPLAVVTTLLETDEPFIDLNALESDVGDVADVVLIRGEELTYALTAGLPQDCATFNGAVRSFPLGDDWIRRPSLARRRYSWSAEDSDQVLQWVIEDLLGMAYRAGLTVGSATAARPAAGVVRRLIAGDSRALVALDSGGIATISAELAFPPAPLSWVLSEGSRVRGMLDPDTSRLALDHAISRTEDLWLMYPYGSVTLALVHEVERQRATLLVHPDHPIGVTRRDLSANTLDRVDLLLTEGDVIAVRVVRDKQGRRALRTIDLDDDELTLPAVALTPGGEPWLEASRPLLEPEPELTVTSIEQFLSTVGITPAAPAQTIAVNPEGPSPTDQTPAAREGLIEAPPAGNPLPGPGLRNIVERPAVSVEQPTNKGPTAAIAPESRTALQSALATVDALKAQLRSERADRHGPRITELQRELGSLKSLVKELLQENGSAMQQGRDVRDRLKDAQASLREARRTGTEVTAESPRDRQARFASNHDWIQHELYLQWIERLDPATRSDHPLPTEASVGTHFAESLEALDDGQLAKALRCAMEAVTGFISKNPAREVHALRTGDGANDAPIIRPSDSARCLRAYIERNTPQARRLHYWVVANGRIELSRVVIHDDMEP
jgi:regulator of replication initiation timing